MRREQFTVNNKAEAPIGVFDSGVGGLSVLRAVRQILPNEDLIFLADQVNVPYGQRSLEEVRHLSEGITRYLLGEGAKLIVVACNTASAAALHFLRQAFPHTTIVGMEPAVKPAAEQTRTGVVGVLATPATFQGALYASVVERFAQGVTVLQDTCPGLVMEIEEGQLDTPRVKSILRAALIPMLQKNIDTVVLGCTHFPFVIPQIETIVGPGVRVIDPAPAIARQVRRLLESQKRMNPGSQPGVSHFLTTGDSAKLEQLLVELLGTQAPVLPLRWDRLSLKLSHSLNSSHPR
jgi:glutamate racemase